MAGARSVRVRGSEFSTLPLSQATRIGLTAAEASLWTSDSSMAARAGGGVWRYMLRG